MPRLSRGLLAMLSTLTGLALLAGCGGEDEETLTKAQYVKKATELCREHRRQISDQLDSFAASRGRDGAATGELATEAMREVILPGFRAQFEDLRQLPAPPGNGRFLALMRMKFAVSLARAETNLASLFHLKPSAYSQFAEGTLMTEEYGIAGCGSLGRSPRAVYAAF